MLENEDFFSHYHLFKLQAKLLFNISFNSLLLKNYDCTEI